VPEVTYQTVLNLPVETVWDFVKDMDNWAPFVTGYREHEVDTDRHSIWTLKGDVGVLARTVKLDVQITVWDPCERVEFTLKGLNEAVEGGGTFILGRVAGEEGDTGAGAPEPEARVGLVRRFLNWFFRRLFRRKFGMTERKQLSAEDLTAQASHLSFTLRMNAGGVSAPLVNAMLGPALEPAAEELANKIAAHLERSAQENG
jgi:carbon monoxide dehydrogenase subunit G